MSGHCGALWGSLAPDRDVMPVEQPPPLGVRPVWVHERDANAARVREICEAVQRYAEAGKPVPLDWLDELGNRVKGDMLPSNLDP